MEKLQVTNVPEGVEKKDTKSSQKFKKASKKATLIGKRVYLSNHLTKLETFTEVSKEDAVAKHLGFTRSIGTVSDSADFERVLKIYFA